MKIIIVIFAGLLLVSECRKLRYYSATRGLLYYLATVHNDELSQEKTKEITDKAMERVIRDFFELR